MDIKNLPGAGHNFRVSSGAGNFSKKFSSAVHFGDLHNLADNKKSVLNAIKSREHDIRVGKFNRLRQVSVYKQIIKAEGDKLTKEDKREIKLLLKHLGGETKESSSTKMVSEKSEFKLNREAKTVIPPKIRINRDPNNNQYDFSQFRTNVRSGVGDKTDKRVRFNLKNNNNLSNQTGLVGSHQENPLAHLK